MDGGEDEESSVLLHISSSTLTSPLSSLTAFQTTTITVDMAFKALVALASLATAVFAAPAAPAPSPLVSCGNGRSVQNAAVCSTCRMYCVPFLLITTSTCSAALGSRFWTTSRLTCSVAERARRKLTRLVLIDYCFTSIVLTAYSIGYSCTYLS